MTQPIIQVKNLVKEFTVGGGFGKEEIFRALHGVSFDIYAGKTLALVGESGCGKSTCARLMTKVYPATEGKFYSTVKTSQRSTAEKISWITAVVYRWCFKTHSVRLIQLTP